MKIYVDGNPKEVCCVTEDGKWSRAPIDGKNTNNMAEYRAILYGLFMHPEARVVVSDSQLVVRQVNGEYRIRNSRLVELADKLDKRIKTLKHPCEIVWAPRDENKAGRILG